MTNYLTVEDMQRRLHISRSLAYTLVKRDDFPVIHIGKRLLIPEDAFSVWMTNGGTQQGTTEDEGVPS